MNKLLGIYIHIPFCIKKCNYCDFCSFPNVTEAQKDAYVSALCRDIASWREKCAGHTVDTVYFGGGTPTLLSVSQFERIFDALHKSFDVSDFVEITTECNPATADVTYFSELHKMGMNRLSIGVQSANDNELKALGRVHLFSDAVKAFHDARVAGFDNISADIMFGIPEQTENSFAQTLERVLELAPRHVSAYGLILEPDTPFFVNQKNLVLPDEDTEYNMYTDAVSTLAAAGLKRYEISNFALPGSESRHNLKYWHRDEYLGFGVSAHSFFDETRFFVPSELDEYIEGAHTVGSERIDRKDAVNEYVMLAMRLTQGVSEAEFEQRFTKSFDEVFGCRIKSFEDVGLIVRDGGRCAFTDRGFYVSNSVLSEIIL